MMKKKSFISLFFVFLMIMLTACNFFGGSTLDNLKNENGVVVDGGGFKQGAILVSEKIEVMSDEGKNVLEVIKNQDYDKDSEVYVYSISVILDGSKIQPNGKVKVKIPFVVNQSSDYVVFHIKDNSDVEKITPSIESNYIVFETSSFSYFVIAQVNKIDETIKYNFKVEVDDLSKGSITENNTTTDYSSGKEVNSGSKITLTANPESGYALKGWYLVEGTDETLLSCATTYEFTVNNDMNIKAVFATKVTLLIEVRGTLIGNDEGSLKVKIKGVTKENHGTIEMDVAKGTEVTLDINTCKGWNFTEWWYYFPTEDGSIDLRTISTSKEYTFTAKEDGHFYAWGQGVPKRMFFTQESINAIYGFRDFKYIEETGTIEKTIKVGTELKEWYYTDVRLMVYFDDEIESSVELLLNDGFTIEVDKNLNTNKVGRYEIKYVYSGYSPSGPVTLSIFINVVE